MALTERPHGYCYSLNDIRYVFTLTDLERTGLFLQVKLLYAKMEDVEFTELYTFEGLKPAADGTVYLYIQEYVNSVLNYVMPAIGTIASNANDQACRFYVEFREIWDESPDTEWTTTETANERIAIKGGIEKHKASRNNIFINYIDTDKPFLTWLPSYRFVWYNEPVYLSFINKTQDDFRIKIFAKGVSGAEHTVNYDYTVATKFFYHFLLTAEQFDLEGELEEPVYYYEVAVYNADETIVLVNPYRLYVEYRPLYEYYDLVYHNSLGGVDAVRVSGETPLSYDRSFEEAETGFNIGEWNAAVKSHMKALSNISLSRKYKGNIGVLKTRTKEQQEAWMDILAGRSIYMRVDDWWVPVVSLQTSQDLGTKKNLKEGFPLEWQLSEANEVFTPAARTFGLGSL